MQSAILPQQPVQWLRLTDLIQRRKRGRSSIYRDVETKLFPPPVRVAANSSAWPEYEVVAIDRLRLAGGNDDDVRALVADLIEARKAV